MNLRYNVHSFNNVVKTGGTYYSSLFTYNKSYYCTTSCMPTYIYIKFGELTITYSVNYFVFTILFIPVYETTPVIYDDEVKQSIRMKIGNYCGFHKSTFMAIVIRETNGGSTCL